MDKSLRCVICNAKLQYHSGTVLMKELLWRKHSSDNLFDTSDRKHKPRKLDIFTKYVPVQRNKLEQLEKNHQYDHERFVFYKLVTGKGFQEFIVYIQLEYCLPSATHFTSKDMKL